MVKKKWLSELTALRAFAIIMVVLGHSMIVYSTKWTVYSMGNNSQFFNVLKCQIKLEIT